ncbi:MAG TPA: hypothetical protein VLF67_01205 [Candidatus Saccharimonas sp.]|nr:hypothetical protein [Candidatus Saccharimonas sp.]
MGFIDYTTYSFQQLRDEKREALRDERAASRQASDWSGTSESRRYGSERAARCRETINEIDAEYRRREEAKEAREEARAERLERAQKAAASAAARATRQAGGGNAAGQTAGQQGSGSVVSKAMKAVNNHIASVIHGTATNKHISEIHIRWVGDDGRNYVGFYNPSTDKVSAWMEVGEGTPRASRINGRWYRRADTPEEVADARAADTSRH